MFDRDLSISEIDINLFPIDLPEYSMFGENGEIPQFEINLEEEDDKLRTTSQLIGKKRKKSKEDENRSLKANENNIINGIEKIKQKDSISTNSQTGKQIQKPKNFNNRRAQKDNFSIKLFKKINDQINQSINSNSQIKDLKLKKPNYNTFTHDTNLIDIYIFLYSI